MLHGSIVEPRRASRYIRSSGSVFKTKVFIPKRSLFENNDARRDNLKDVRNELGTLWVIDEGLTPSDRVVVEGLQKVRDGVLVVAKPAPAESSPSGALAQTATAPPAVTPPPAAKPGEK